LSPLLPHIFLLERERERERREERNERDLI